MSKPDTIEEVFFNLWENSGIPKGQIASLVGKPMSTLSREMSVWDSGAKLGIELQIPLMNAFHSLAPLHFLASAMGAMVVPMTGSPDGEDMRHEILQAVMAVGKFIEAAEHGEHYMTLHKLHSEARKELEDILLRAHTRDALASTQKGKM